MRYYLDTEFNEFRGELISLALVRQDGKANFYTVLGCDNPGPWVAKNVMPYLFACSPMGSNQPIARRSDPPESWIVSRHHAAYALAAFLKGDPDNYPVIIADWPEDIAHLCQLLITGPGLMAKTGNDIRMVYRETPGWCTADHSEVPHNAYYDAVALRDYWEYTIKDD